MNGFEKESQTMNEQLQMMANRLRVESIRATTAAGSGHPTTCLSAAEIVAALFFREMRPADEFVLSKGHAAPLLWAVFAETGIVDRDELLNLRKITSNLEGHPTPRMPRVKVATGSLGQGLSAGVGMALGHRLQQTGGRVFVLLGDGECAEGSVWEAANSAADHHLGNLVAVVDVNGLGQSQETQHRHDLETFQRKFTAFGWEATIVDGHDPAQILAAFARPRPAEKPFVVLARTFKGKGVSFLENKPGWHGKPLNQQEMEKALTEIPVDGTVMKGYIPPERDPHPAPVADFPYTPYALGELVATRAAFGKALVSSGRSDPRLVAIDADVRNSTMMEDFFRQFPDRSFQTYIAEQNMLGMAIGFSARGLIPVVSTFATFLTRAYDFIRMAVYSRANIKIAGSHAGISIGPDGPSQMGLEDITMFMPFPDVHIFYPSDAVSTERCFREMNRHYGLSYLRLTREKTPVIYSTVESFPAGGLKVVRRSDRDRALVIAAGITLHEALMAQHILEGKGISIRVIDLYSLKPLPIKALQAEAAQVTGPVLVVEDHYDFGMGTAVSQVLSDVVKLCVTDIPRSGATGDLLEAYGISAAAIVRAIEKTLN